MKSERVQVVTDSGTSIRPGSPQAKEIGVTVVPLGVSIYEKGAYVAHLDLDSDVPLVDFYKDMITSPKSPQTSGAVVGPLKEIYQDLSRKGPVISIHITSRHSTAYGSAYTARSEVQDAQGEINPIEIVDSKFVSLATWFLVELAASLSKAGASLNEIKEQVLLAIPKIQIYTVLANFDNLRKGGRGTKALAGVMASILSIYPVIGFRDGELTPFNLHRTSTKAIDTMIQMVGDEGRLARLAIVHTNAPDLAKSIKEKAKKIYPGEITTHDGGPPLSSHAGIGAIAIASLKK
jgi:DegV family protein with EDD domain